MNRRHLASRLRAFSLAELVVVMGIVALLVAMLLPAISAVRERANQTKCLAILRSIGTAAQLHAAEHRGFLPAGGWHWSPVGGLCNPRGLLDSDERKYRYYVDAGVKRPLPVTAALAHFLNVNVQTGSRAALESDLQKDELRRLFACPSQREPLAGWSQREDGPGWTAPPEYSSYIFNEALLGKRDGKKPSVLGQLSRVRDASHVLFAMDGRPRDNTTDRWLMLFDFGPADTVADFQRHVSDEGIWLGHQGIDTWRHRGRANVLFCDWHVEGLSTTDNSLATVGLSKGLQR